MVKFIKSIADVLVRRISQALPSWHDYTVEQDFPTQPSYQLIAPVNLAVLPATLRRHFAKPMPLPAHRVYRLRNVHVTWDGAVFNNFRLFTASIVHPRFASRFQDTLLLRQWVGEKVELPAPCIAVCHDQWSVENYYHWLIDTLPRLLILRQSHPGMLLLLPQPLAPKQLPDYITRTATVLGFTRYLPLTTRQILRAGCVVLPELTAASLTQNPELVRQVRVELLAVLAPAPVSATRKVYAARAAGGVRCLVNESEVDTLLSEFGFEKVYFEELTFLEQVALMRETVVFLGVHGAGMTNMLFLPEAAQVAELLNADFGDPCYGLLASCLGLPYFCLPSTGSQPALQNQSHLIVDITLLRQALVSMLGRRTASLYFTS